MLCQPIPHSLFPNIKTGTHKEREMLYSKKQTRNESPTVRRRELIKSSGVQ